MTGKVGRQTFSVKLCPQIARSTPISKENHLEQKPLFRGTTQLFTRGDLTRPDLMLGVDHHLRLSGKMSLELA
jgi:hypothetical protein